MLRKDAVTSCPQVSIELPAGCVDSSCVMSTTQEPMRPQQLEVLACCPRTVAVIFVCGEEVGPVVVVTPGASVTVVVVITGYVPES